VQIDVGMHVQKLPHQRRFVSAQIVENDMDLSAGRLRADHFTQKSHEVLAGVTRRCFVRSPRWTVD
jgi:hypothetical protein